MKKNSVEISRSCLSCSKCDTEECPLDNMTESMKHTTICSAYDTKFEYTTCKHLGRLVNQGLELCFAEGDVNFPKCGPECPSYDEVKVQYKITIS